MAPESVGEHLQAAVGDEGHRGHRSRRPAGRDDLVDELIHRELKPPLECVLIVKRATRVGVGMRADLFIEVGHRIGVELESLGKATLSRRGIGN